MKTHDASPSRSPVGGEAYPLLQIQAGADDYVMQYGGRCRDCADHDGICPASHLPCDSAMARLAIRGVVEALNYGLRGGFIYPDASPAPTQRDVSGMVEKLVTKWIKAGELIVDHVEEDRGIQPEEYVEFAMRILSALASPPSPSKADVGALVEALRPFHDLAAAEPDDAEPMWKVAAEDCRRAFRALASFTASHDGGL